MINDAKLKAMARKARAINRLEKSKSLLAKKAKELGFEANVGSTETKVSLKLSFDKKPLFNTIDKVVDKIPYRIKIEKK